MTTGVERHGKGGTIPDPTLPSPDGQTAFDAASWAVPSKLHVERIRAALRSLIDLGDLSRREVERRLVAHGAGLDLNRLLSGRFSLKLHQVLDLCRVLDLHPVELFRLVFKPPLRRCPLLQRLDGVFASSHPQLATPTATTPPAAAETEELRRRVEDLQRTVEQMRRLSGRAAGLR